MKSITWKIGGEAGFGIITAGTMLARAFARNGYHVFGTNEYPSLIRGGHNLITVRISTEPFDAMNRDVHILVALNKESVDLHKNELQDGSIVVYDPKDYEWKKEEFTVSVHLIPLTLTEIVKEKAGDAVMRNTVALGATVALLGVDFTYIEQIIRDQFVKKGEEVITHNITIAKAGFDAIKTSFSQENAMYLAPAQKSEPQLVLNASEAVGIGAVRAGLKFAAIYPMTPINSLITFLADHAKEFQLVYKQPEDEIAGINMALGASISGVRSMVATSGGGFALMVEGLSLAGFIEAPVVIDLGMRVGPATGMPTYTEQGELQFAIHAGHGEFPRIVLAPGDATEAYRLTIDAFNLSDRYQTPVILLTDKYLNESQWCVKKADFEGNVIIDRGKLVKPDELDSTSDFKRYQVEVTDGVSPRSIPGMKNGLYYANSYEHRGDGHMIERADLRKAMVEKRLLKFEAMKKDWQAPRVYGDENAEITFITWGSTKGPVLEAMKLLKLKDKTCRVLHFTWMYPFPVDLVVPLLNNQSRYIDIEQNATGQFASLIREHTGIEINEKLLKYDGRPWYPEEIIERVAS